MKLPVLLGALVLSALPAVADDFVYLNCKTTINSTVFDWTKSKELNKWISHTDVLYKIDAKNELLFVSSNPEVAIQYEPQHPGFIGWTEQVSGRRISGENPMYLQYDPPGEVSGAMYHSDNVRRLKYFANIFGDCEPSDASAYKKALKESES